MNRDQMEGKWNQLAGQARERWGKLTDDDMQQLKGNSQQLAGKIQERYGYTKEQADRELEEWLGTVDA